MNIIKCRICGKEKEHQAKGLCYNCYRKHEWKQKLITCKRCGRQKPNHAKGLCAGCYQFVFRLEPNKAWNHKKNYGIDMQLYKKITSKCVICSFSKIVELHHLDGNKENNSESNLIGVCPNHHRMIHEYKYRQEMLKILKEKGFSIPNDPKLDFSLN